MKLNQKQKVIRHLETYGSITPLDAFRDYGIMRLAAVIFNLKEDGYNIDSEMTTSTNRFGEKVNFAKYTANEQEKVS
tara:strand:+ start:2297 stop:2527 length:231 start_codon:yes stop_codon:yes gene_type:complete